MLCIQLALFGVICYKIESEHPINYFISPIGYPHSVLFFDKIKSRTDQKKIPFSLAALAGVSIDQHLDGKNIWPALSYNSNSPRNDVLLHLDDVDGFQSYINGEYKYLNGSSSNGSYDRWMDNIDEHEFHPMFDRYGESIMESSVGQALAPYSLTNLTALTIEKHRQSSIITCNNVPMPTIRLLQCFPLESPCLFNITEDPCERRNIAALNSDAIHTMTGELNKFRLKSKPIRNKPSDERANPSAFNNTWTWWFDELNIPDYTEIVTSPKSKRFATYSILSNP